MWRSQNVTTVSSKAINVLSTELYEECKGRNLELRARFAGRTGSNSIYRLTFKQQKVAELEERLFQIEQLLAGGVLDEDSGE